MGNIFENNGTVNFSAEHHLLMHLWLPNRFRILRLMFLTLFSRKLMLAWIPLLTLLSRIKVSPQTLWSICLLWMIWESNLCILLFVMEGQSWHHICNQTGCFWEHPQPGHPPLQSSWKQCGTVAQGVQRQGNGFLLQCGKIRLKSLILLIDLEMSMIRSWVLMPQIM